LEKISRIKEDILRACLAQLQLHEFLEMVIHSSSLEIMTGSSPAYSIKKIQDVLRSVSLEGGLWCSTGVSKLQELMSRLLFFMA